MELREALTVLGLGPDASWDAIRTAHRSRILRAHPDAGGSPSDAARVNQALDVLAAATDHGATPLPQPAPPPPSPAGPVDPAMPTRTVSADDPTDVLLRLADAAHDIGEVVFVDPLAGLLEVVVGEAPEVGQLTASVDLERTGDGVPVAFTLEPLGVAAAPPIHDVVADLMACFRHRSRYESRRPPAGDGSPR